MESFLSMNSALFDFEEVEMQFEDVVNKFEEIEEVAGEDFDGSVCSACGDDSGMKVMSNAGGLKCSACGFFQQRFEIYRSAGGESGGSSTPLSKEGKSSGLGVMKRTKEKNSSVTIKDPVVAERKAREIHRAAVIQRLKELVMSNAPNIGIPDFILMNVADQYLDIYDIRDGSGKKIVKRGRIKVEIVGSLIYYHCMANNIPKRKTAIIKLMGLTSNGLSGGDQFLLALEGSGRISLPRAEGNNDYSPYIKEFCAKCGIIEDWAFEFCIRMLERAEQLYIGNNSIVPSLVTGLCWLIVSHLDDKGVKRQGLVRTRAEVEHACNDTRANTFMRFLNEIAAVEAESVASNGTQIYFKDILETYDISLNNCINKRHVPAKKESM